MENVFNLGELVRSFIKLISQFQIEQVSIVFQFQVFETQRIDLGL